MSSPRYRLSLGAILAAAAAARLVDLSTDAPLDAARDLSLSVDGAWYAGAALDRAAGRRGSGGGPYDRPIYTALVGGAIGLLGPGIPAAGLVAAASGMAAIILTASAARRIHGPEAGLIAAGLLSFDYAFLFHNRAPNVYATAALFSAGVLRLCAGRGSAASGRKALALAWATALIGTLGVKSILFLLAGALLWAAPPSEAVRRKLKRPVALLVLSVLGALALGLAWRMGWVTQNFHKLKEYLLTGPGAPSAEGGGILWSIATLELRSGIAALSPALFMLLCIRLLEPRRESSPLGEKVAAIHILLTLVLLAPLKYSPIRYLIPLYPAMAILASRAVLDLLGSPASSPVLPDPPSPASRGRAGTRPRAGAWRALRMGGAAYFLLQGALALTGPPAWTVLLAMVLLAGGTAAVLERALAPGAGIPAARAARSAAIALAGAFLVLGASRGGVALAEPRRSLQNASAQIDAILSPCAHLTGPFAHALTYSSTLRRTYIPRLFFGKGRLGRTLRSQGFTHLATSIPEDPELFFGAFFRDGAELEPVWEFAIRGARVGLYRLPWAEEICPRSDFERGLDALKKGLRAEAALHLERALKAHPRSAAAATALGHCLLAEGREGEAVPYLEAALSWNPDELRAARALLSLRLKNREMEAARELALRIHEADPLDEEAGRLAQALRRLQ